MVQEFLYSLINQNFKMLTYCMLYDISDDEMFKDTYKYLNKTSDNYQFYPQEFMNFNVGEFNNKIIKINKTAEDILYNEIIVYPDNDIDNVLWTLYQKLEIHQKMTQDKMKYTGFINGLQCLYIYYMCHFLYHGEVEIFDYSKELFEDILHSYYAEEYNNFIENYLMVDLDTSKIHNKDISKYFTEDDLSTYNKLTGQFNTMNDMLVEYNKVLESSQPFPQFYEYAFYLYKLKYVDINYFEPDYYLLSLANLFGITQKL